MTNVIDHYQIEKTLGAGFSAKVKLASDDKGNKCALKIFNLRNPNMDKENLMNLAK